MPDKRWLLYGAYGYTGRIIADVALEQGLSPVLAGRRAEPLREMSDHLGFEHRVFDLDTADNVARELESFDAVVLAAGPFSATSAPVVEACLRTGTHYLDITGEIEVFESCHRRGPEARRAGCVLMPGVGFDVVPSDCLAASLSSALPEANQLELAFHGSGGSSAGTLKSMLEGLAKGGAVREHGRIVPVPMAWKTLDVPFRHATRHCVSIPWGDVSTAYYSTGIPNIIVYMALKPSWASSLRTLRPALALLGIDLVQDGAKALVERLVDGPSAETRTSAVAHLWGRVTAPDGRILEGTLQTPEGYRLTAYTTVESTRRVLEGNLPAGTFTPAMAFGKDYICEFEGCDLRIG